MRRKPRWTRPGASRRLCDRPHHPGRSERGFVGVRAGPAGGALDAGRQLVGIGEQQQRLAADAHRADRDRFATVGGMAGLQGRAIVGDRVGMGEALGRRRRQRQAAASSGARGGAGARAPRRRRERGGRGARAGRFSGFAPRLQVLCSRTNDISGLGAILRAGVVAVKGRRLAPEAKPLWKGGSRTAAGRVAIGYSYKS